MPTISRRKVKELIPNGKFFSVCYTKRTDGTTRHMNCRVGVTKYLKGGKLAYNPDDYDLVVVFDMQKKAYRMVDLNTLTSMTIKGRVYNVK